MKYEIISSSSKANCIIVENILMLDCGVSYSKIKKHLSKVKLIFISHAHQDHLNANTIKQITYNYPTIKYVTGSKVVVNKLIGLNVNAKNIFILEEYKRYNLGAIKASLEPLIHDTPNYALKCEMNGEKMIYIVDTANVDNIVAPNYDLYLIENNYQEEILQEHIRKAEEENDGNKLYYLDRVLNTHLSKSKCDSFLIENMGDNSTYQYIHLSKYNNTENGEVI